MFALMYITPHLSIRVYMFQDSTCSLVDKFQFSAHVFTLIFIAQSTVQLLVEFSLNILSQYKVFSVVWSGRVSQFVL
jgi:hypothetical protein